MDTIHKRPEGILVIEAPPRHGKSEFISKYLPAWFLCRYPEKRVILTSYEANFARSWGRKARGLIEEHGWEWFGVTVSREQQSAVDWEIAGHAGGMVTAGVGGPLTGRGADLLIVDDPIKNAEQAVSELVRSNQWDWWQSTASTRVEPGGVIIVIQTRWHQDDLTGRLLTDAQEEGQAVRRLRLPAIAEDDDPLGRSPGEALWPERWPIEALERRRKATDVYWWNSLYQQRPSQHGRTEWPASYFGPHIWTDDFRLPFDMSAIAIDPSKGRDQKRGDYAAVVFVGLRGGLLYVNAWIDRQPADVIVANAIEMQTELQADRVALEANAWQDLLAPEIDRQCAELRVPPMPLQLVENRVQKELRISRIGPYLARKQLRFADTTYNRLLVRQLEDFPLGEHDDGPDALEMAIRLLGQIAAGDYSQDYVEAF